MNIESEIDEISGIAGNIAYKFSKAAIFGNDTTEMYYDLLRINAYLRTLERNQVETVVTKSSTPIAGQTVSMSSLKKKNNVLILDQPVYCLTTEIEPCLSDEKICQIIELARVMCYKYNN